MQRARLVTSSPTAATTAKDVAQRIILTRRALGYTQEDICRELGLRSRGTWANYEVGWRMIPVHMVVLFCDKLGVTTDWILRGLRRTLDAECRAKIEVMEEQDRKAAAAVTPRRKKRGRPFGRKG
jgi:transcriptional regulator with XRE-family HTH domain